VYNKLQIAALHGCSLTGLCLVVGLPYNCAFSNLKKKVNELIKELSVLCWCFASFFMKTNHRFFEVFE
jgi:hypothetical protein